MEQNEKAILYGLYSASKSKDYKRINEYSTSNGLEASWLQGGAVMQIP